MADVDKSIRILNFVVSDKYLKSSKEQQNEIIKEFLEIPDSNKPISFRNRSYNDLEKFFSICNFQVRKIIEINNESKMIDLLEDTNNNLVGADLIAAQEKDNFVYSQRIELKFGAETLANIGNDSMNTIFGLNNSQVNFVSLAKNLKNKQQKFVIDEKNGANEKSFSNLESLINDFVKQLNFLNQNKLMKINKDELNNLLNTTGSIKNSHLVGNNLLKLFINYKKDIKQSITVAKKLNLDGEWTIKSIKKSEDSNRVEIKISNSINVVKFLLNWKNSYKKNNEVYPAKLGVGSSSWNVWVYEEKSK
ncbi:hypothetical protein [Mycoplasmopsis iners]|uniref:hypothetical protein n=1 Tax=Mycoplasmopsis iners TaxID=76630 RepID=UPI00049640E6|nr:hypothetical protein [Mycoplasmopsis iners]